MTQSHAGLDVSALEHLQGRLTADCAGALGLLLAWLGDRAGVYRAMQDIGPAGAPAIAARAGVDERYTREWLAANAAAGYVTWDPAGETFALSPEQAFLLAQDGDPAGLRGFIELIVEQYLHEGRAREIFRSGAGLPPDAQHASCCCGADRLSRHAYVSNLIDRWIPSLAGVQAKLTTGGRVADVGCGVGSATLLMAQAFPKSQFHGFDIHAPSIEQARAEATRRGVTNARFDVVAARELPGHDYDLVCLFDALHDTGDPVAAATRIRKSLSPAGVLMLVEPASADRLADNLNVYSRIFYAASTLVCTPASRAQEGRLTLGAQAGPRRLAHVLNNAGFRYVRRTADTPTNIVLEARA
jgi:SAM-dependent methyltransferase